MYSQEAIQYCPNGLLEVPKLENDFVLDLSVRTQEEANGCHGGDIFANGLHSPELKLGHVGDPNGCALSPTILPLTPNATTRNGKPTRPFKAYPKNFLGLATAEGIIDDSDMRFLEFRRQCLSQIHATTGGTTGNKNMKRPVQAIRPAQSVSPTQLPSSSIKDQTDLKDQAYWERRRKNNEAAKKSRDARRAKEDEIAIRAAFLERENLQLRLELASLKGEVERLRCILYEKK